MDLHKLTENLRNMTDELNSIEGVEVISTAELKKQRDALKAENERLRDGIIFAIDEDAMSDESDYQWLCRVKLMLIELLPKGRDE